MKQGRFWWLRLVFVSVIYLAMARGFRVTQQGGGAAGQSGSGNVAGPAVPVDQHTLAELRTEARIRDAEAKFAEGATLPGVGLVFTVAALALTQVGTENEPGNLGLAATLAVATLVLLIYFFIVSIRANPRARAAARAEVAAEIYEQTGAAPQSFPTTNRWRESQKAVIGFALGVILGAFVVAQYQLGDKWVMMFN